MTVGARLKRLRVARGMTQKELAEPHYSHAYVSTIEAGRRAPSRAALEHFGKKLEVDVEELMTGRPPDLASRLSAAVQQARLQVAAGAISEAERSFQATRRSAVKFDLPRVAAEAVEGIALCAERRGRLDEAVDLYDEALQFVTEESPLASVEAIAGKARCLQLRGDMKYAIYLLEGHLERLEREGLADPGALVRLYSSLGRAYFDSGLFTKASEMAGEALRLAPRVEDPVRLAHMHLNVALVLIQRGEISEADSVLRKAEDLYKQAELETDIGRAYLARGFALSRGERYDEARELFASARAVFEKTSSSLDEARTLNEIARLDRLAGDLDRAITSLRRAAGLLEESDVAELATSHRELGLCLMGSDDLEAEKHLRRAVELFERAEESTQLAATYRALGDLFRARGDEGAGCEAYRTGIVVLEERL